MLSVWLSRCIGYEKHNFFIFIFTFINVYRLSGHGRLGSTAPDKPDEEWDDIGTSLQIHRRHQVDITGNGVWPEMER